MEEYLPAPFEKVEYPNDQVRKALKKISKHKPEDELNCGGCGYGSCREFVNALIAGDAEPSMCVSYMRKIAVRKAAAMLRCMPSAVVIVDSNMEIVEANDSFEQMFLGEMYGVEIDDDTLDGFETVEDVVGYVEDYLCGKE